MLAAISVHLCTSISAGVQQCAAARLAKTFYPERDHCPAFAASDVNLGLLSVQTSAAVLLRLHVVRQTSRPPRTVASPEPRECPPIPQKGKCQGRESGIHPTSREKELAILSAKASRPCHPCTGTKFSIAGCWPVLYRIQFGQNRLIAFLSKCYGGYFPEDSAGTDAQGARMEFHPPSGSFELIFRDREGCGELMFIPTYNDQCDSQEQEIRTGVGFFAMYAHPRVTSIVLHGMDITPEAAVDIIKMFSMDVLTCFEYTHSFEDATAGARILSEVSTRFTLIRKLKLAQCEVTDLSPISALQLLEFLSICIVYDPRSTKLDVFAALPNLRKLTLEDSPRSQDVEDLIDHGAIDSFIRLMYRKFSPRFRELACYLESVGPDVIIALLEAPTELGIFQVNFCQGVPFDQLANEYFIPGAAPANSSLSPFLGLQSLPTTLRQVFICQCQQDELALHLYEVGELMQLQFEKMNLRVHIGSCSRDDCTGYCTGWS